MTITKATPHITQNEALVFERSQTGRRGYRLPALDVEEDAQGALEVMYELQQHLAEITGLPGVSLQPAAGAHGEMTGVMMIRAFLDARDGAGEGDSPRRNV